MEAEKVAKKVGASKFRLNADLAPDVAGALQELAEAQGVSVSEAVRRAISNDYFLKQKRKEGAKVLLEDARGKLKELVFVGS